MADPVRCVCGGRAADCLRVSRWWFVYCTKQPGGYDCWHGPVRKTRAGAVRAWNRLMDAARKEKARG